MMKKIMILGASILQLPAIEKAKAMGLEVVVVDKNPNAVGFCVGGTFNEIISTTDIPAVVEAAKKHRIDGIMTLATDMPMRSVAEVVKEMSLVGISPETALKATNKVEMRRALKKHGVPIPVFYKVSDSKEYECAVSNMRVPFIVKPADSSGSRGIFEVQDIHDQNLIQKAYAYCLPFSKCGDVVVEEYMQGPEVSVETLSIDGNCNVIQITDKLTTGAPHYVEIGHSQPTQLPSEVLSQIACVAKAANQAVGIENGPSHTEIIVTKEGPKIVEIGARLGGDNITTHLVPLSTGVDMVESCIRIALGEKPDITPKYSKGSAIRYFHQHAGVLMNIDGLDAARNIPGVKQISIVCGTSEQITDIVDSGSRIGFVIAQGENASEAIAVAEKALACVKIDIKS